MHEQCNCPWMGCPVHPQALCTGTADTMECGNPECPLGEHPIGEHTLADGMHLCRPCGHALVHIFAHDVPKLMQEFQPYVPEWVKPLDAFVCRAYKAPIERGIGWELPYVDACAVLVLACITEELDTEHRIPRLLLLQLLHLQGQILEITEAFADRGHHIPIQEE